MKKLLILLVSLSVFTSCLNNTDKEKLANSVSSAGNQTVTRDSANLTTIEWLDSAKHLGTITQGEVLKLDYRFKNTGNKPLIIASVRPGCGCTVADYPKEPIAPGETGIIKAEFDSKGKEGFQSKSISVDANTKESFTLWFDVKIEKATN
jgi:hypothetical protein